MPQGDVAGAVGAWIALQQQVCGPSQNGAAMSITACVANRQDRGRLVAAWRWDRRDQFPNGMPFGRELLSVLRAGPPWPTIDEVFGRLNAP